MLTSPTEIVNELNMATGRAQRLRPPPIFFSFFSPKSLYIQTISVSLHCKEKENKTNNKKQKIMKKAMYATVSVLGFTDPQREGTIYCRTFADKGRAMRWVEEESGKLADRVKTTILRTVVTSAHRLSVAELEAAMSRDAKDYTGVCARLFWGGERSHRRQDVFPYFYALDYVKYSTEWTQKK